MVHDATEFRLSPIKKKKKRCTVLEEMSQTAQSIGVHQLMQDTETPGFLCSPKTQLLQSDITLTAVCASVYLKM